MKQLNRWVYAIVGVVVLLFAGLVYAWSVLSTPIGAEFTGWTKAQLSLTFTLVMILFCVILYLFGLCIALAVMFCGIMLAMHERRWWMLAIFSVSMPVFIYVVFQVLLRVKLPMGIIFS